MTHNIQILKLRYPIPLAPPEVIHLRSGVCKIIKQDEILESLYNAGIELNLFYNHHDITGNTQNRYPLIQYQSEEGQATLVGINEGAVALDVLQQLLKKHPKLSHFHINGKRDEFLVNPIVDGIRTFSVRLLRTEKEFIIKNWLPFDEQREINWEAAKQLINRVQILDERLPAQIAAMLKGTGYDHNLLFSAYVTNIFESKGKVRVFKDRFEEYEYCFDCSFNSNLDLPLGIGIARSPSIGFGRISAFKNK